KEKQDVGRAVASPVSGDGERRVVLPPELQALEGRARERDDPGEARIDGCLPGRCEVRARGQWRGVSDAEEGGNERGNSADEDLGQRRGLPGRPGAGRSPD